jgi:hypothetical protein
MADEMAKALSEYERSEEIFESDAILGSETAKWVASFMRQVQTPR